MVLFKYKLSRIRHLLQTKQLAAVLVGFWFAVVFLVGSPSKITVEELEDMVFLRCDTNIEWWEGTQPLPHGKMWNLGKRNLDPRGMYMCNGTDEQEHKRPFTQVYFRSMCLLDPLV